MSAYELTLEQCKQWAAELGYAADWRDLLRDAKVGAEIANRDNIRSRSRVPNGRRVQHAIREALDRAEAKRREPTMMGTLVRSLERWQQLGDDLARTRPATFLAVTRKIEEILGKVALAEAAAAATADLERIESGLDLFEPADDQSETKNSAKPRRDVTPERPAKR